MVAGDAQCRAVRHHGHHQLQHVDHAGAPVHQVADEDGLASLRVGDRITVVSSVTGYGRCDPVSQAFQQRDQFIETAVYVSDDVEGPRLIPAIGPRWHTLDAGRLHVLGSVEHVDIAETLASQSPDGPAQLLRLLADDVRAKVPVVPFPVAGKTNRLGHVQHDCHRKAVMLPRQSDQRPAGLGLHAGGVNGGEAPGTQAGGCNEIQESEGFRRSRLVVGVVGHHGPAGVGGHHLGGLEVPGGKGGLSRAGRSNQRHQAEFRDFQVHRVKTPIWVGAPRPGSSAPMPWKRTS